MHKLFVKNPAQYKRDMDVARAYFQDNITGLSLKYNISIEEATEFVMRMTNPDTGAMPFKDKPTRIVHYNEHGDREFAETTFLNYPLQAQRADFILSPSMVMYENPDREHAITSKYIAVNVKRRNDAKGEMYSAKEAKQWDLHTRKNNEQTNKKLDNNAVSGAHVSKSTPLHKPSIHTSLTSRCRISASYGNANNDKVIAGNRHYYSPDIIEANILAIIRLADMDELAAMIAKYNLVYPTVEQAYAVVEKSAHRYFRNPWRMMDIKDLLAGLSPVQRAAFVYIGDLYHTAKYNNEFVFGMIDKLSTVKEKGVPSDAQRLVKQLPEDAQVLVALMCGHLFKGKSLKSINTFSDEVKGIIAATAINVYNHLEYYTDFIRAIFVTDIVPPSVAVLPTYIREAVLAGDTDSTIFTVESWKEWRFGELTFKSEQVNFGHVVAMFTSASITNILAISAKNIGVRDRQLFQYGMKSEFYFAVFGLTTRGKTYFGMKSAQEGLIAESFTVDTLEDKGAVFKGSNTPAFIVDGARDARMKILQTVFEDKKVSALEYLRKCSELEHQIMKGLREGDTTFYKRTEIKPSTAYTKDAELSPYQHYLLWEEVFAPKYGHTIEPPYDAIKLSLDSDGKRPAFMAWLEGIEDAQIRDSLKEYLRRNNKKHITQIMIPTAVAVENGIPQELLDGMGVRKIVANLMEPYYVVLESLNQFFTDKNQLRLVSDYH